MYTRGGRGLLASKLDKVLPRTGKKIGLKVTLLCLDVTDVTDVT